jgi:hypothetical protein
MLLTPEDWVKRAETHRSKSRAQHVDPSDAFLVTSTNDRSRPTHAPPFSESDVASYVALQYYTPSWLPRDELEATTIFDFQTRHLPTIDVIQAVRPEFLPMPFLPGGIPLVDHAAAFLTHNSDWKEIRPHLEELRSSRLPLDEDVDNVLELGLGHSTDEEWMDATAMLAKMSSESSLYPLIAASVGYIRVKADWGRTDDQPLYDSLMDHIQMSAAAGDSCLTLSIAESGDSQCSMPARFIIGNAHHTIHVVLPVGHHGGTGSRKIAISMETKLSSCVQDFFLSIGTAVGFNITDGYVKWARLLGAVWDVQFPSKMALPVELDDLAHLARINTAFDSLLHLNYYCFGTVLPRSRCATGDNRWTQPYKVLPRALQMFLVGNVTQTSKVASLLCTIISIQTFPDMTIVKESSNFSTVTFLQWHHGKFLAPQLVAKRVILLSEAGTWLSVIPPPDWVPQQTYRDLVARVNPPFLQKYGSIWCPADWPSMCAGGPRSIHQVRSVYLDQLIDLRVFDPESWPIFHEDKRLIWRYGLPREIISVPVETPVSSPYFVTAPTVTNCLPLNPEEWTPANIRPSIIPGIRGDRCVISEFMRIHPDLAPYVHEFALLHKEEFKALVNPRRLIKIVMDIRNLLKQLNGYLFVPDLDPYYVKEASQRKADKSIKHLKSRAEYCANQERVHSQKVTILQAALGGINGRPTLATSTNMAQHVPGTLLVGVVPKSSTTKRGKNPRKQGTAKDELLRPLTRPTPEMMEQSEPEGELMEVDAVPAVCTRTVRWRTQLEDFAPSPEEESASEFAHDKHKPPTSGPTPTVVVGREASITSAQGTASPLVDEALVVIPSPAFPDDMAPHAVYRCALLRPRTSVLGTRAGVTLRILDLRTIAGTNFLNDNVINYYLSLILAKAKATLDIDAFALSTYFYSSMVRGNISMDSWTSGIDIFIKDYVLFPIHTGAGDHWCLAVFDVRKHTLNVYDSIPNEGRKFDILHHVREYIREEHKSKHGLPYPYALNEDSVPNVPLQTNGFDCGVFVCQYVKAIVRGVRFNFRSKDMQIIRRTMIWETAIASISWDHVNPDLMNAG